MDEFFRQHDPQYAAEHPEEHAGREEIYENLMAGRISALDEKLAALGQTQEDYLPSEIEKFKDATGYEEFLDFDPAVIKAALENPDKSHADEMLAFAEQAGREYEAELFGESKEPMKESEPAPGFHAPQADVDPAVLAEAAEIAGACDDILRNNLLYDAAIRDVAEVTEMILRGDTDKLKAGLSTLGREEGMAAEVAPLISLLEAFEKEHGIGAHEQQTPSPDDRETGETVRTPRGTFYVTDMSREQMEAAGYGFHHQSDDGKYLIMGNGSRSFAIRNEEAQEHAAPEKMTVLVVEPGKEPYSAVPADGTKLADAYMQTFQLEQDVENIFNLVFQPVTGKAGDTLSIQAITILRPSYLPEGAENPNYGFYHSANITIPLQIAFEKDAPAEGQKTAADNYEIVDIPKSITDSDEYFGLENSRDTNTALSVVPAEDENGSVIYSGDGTVTFKVRLYGGPEADHNITVFVNHQPVQINGADYLAVRTQKDKMVEATITLDASAFGENNTI